MHDIAHNAQLRANNQLANALRELPRELKDEWGPLFADEATQGFRTLLAGATHKCPACGFDSGPVDRKTGKVYRCGCHMPNIHAVRLYAELRGAVGPQNQIALTLIGKLGVDFDAAKGYIARGQAADAGAENPLDAAERFVDALVVLCEAHPEARRIVARLGSYAAVEGTEAE